MLQAIDDSSTPPSAATPSASPARSAREIAATVVDRVERGGAWLDRVLDAELAGSNLPGRDRRLLAEIATGVVRHRLRLDWLLEQFYHGDFSRCAPAVRNALRVALYQILYLDRVPPSAAVNEAVESVKHNHGGRSAKLVNGLLRSLLRRIDSLPEPDRSETAKWLSVTYSHPLWLVERWLETFGREATVALLEADNRRPAVSIRINPHRVDPDTLKEHLTERGATLCPSPLVDSMLRATGLGGIATDPAFADGWYSIQDEGAYLAAMLADVRPEMYVIDLCSAPGGKSIAMAEMLDGRGRIVAVDRFEKKVRRLAESLERSGWGDLVETLAADARSVELPPADVVLADVPCSGLGVLAKKPDIRWRRQQQDIPPLRQLQDEILDNAARLVKPGGALVYSTCTIEPVENRGAVLDFLERTPGFTLADARSVLPAEVIDRGVVTDDGMLQTLPHVHEVDGMFAARMIRNR